MIRCFYYGIIVADSNLDSNWRKGMDDDNKYIAVCKVTELLFYAYFVIMLFAKGIGLYEGMAAYNICLLLSTGILAFKLSMDRYSVKEIAVTAVLVLTGFLVWRNSGEKGPLLYILLVIGMKGIPVKRVFKVGLLVWGATFVMQVLLTLTGWKSDIFVAHDKLGLGHIIRWSLGYPHPNVLHISYVILIAFVLYVLELKGRKLVWATIICFVGNLYVFMYSISYTGLIFTIGYLSCNLYLSLRTERTKLENVLIEAVFPCCVLFSVIGPLVIKGRLFEMIDKILNTRFYMSNRFMLEGEWTLFGSRQIEVKKESMNFTLDCSYTNLLMSCGIVIFLLMCIGYLMLIHSYLKENKNKELAIIIGLSIAGITEPFLFNTAYKNLSLIFMGSFIFEQLRRKNDRNTLSIRVLPFGDKGIAISYGMLHRVSVKVKDAFDKKKKQIAITGVLAGAAIGITYAAAVKLPDSIYMLKAGNDRYDKVVYLDMNNLPPDFNSRVLNYTDEKTPMYEFTGNMITVEYIRGIVSSGLIGGALAAFVCVVIFAAKSERYTETKRENINGK